ncbi:MAG: NIPSNAP family protein [Acidobacteriota bacterium]
MVLLKVSYRLRAHHVATYEKVFAERTLPLIRAHGLNFRGIWRSFVGDAQEYLELFEFESLAEFETRWRALGADPRLQEIFAITGPLVEDEKFTLFDPLLTGDSTQPIQD